jgi:hypothetical protein
MRILCRTSTESVLTGQGVARSPVSNSRRPYSLVPGAARAAKAGDRFRDSRSTQGVDPPGPEVAACAVHSPELGPRYRLLYSPVGNPPARFRSNEAAASAAHWQSWLIRQRRLAALSIRPMRLIGDTHA